MVRRLSSAISTRTPICLGSPPLRPLRNTAGSDPTPSRSDLRSTVPSRPLVVNRMRIDYPILRARFTRFGVEGSLLTRDKCANSEDLSDTGCEAMPSPDRRSVVRSRRRVSHGGPSRCAPASSMGREMARRRVLQPLGAPAQRTYLPPVTRGIREVVRCLESGRIVRPASPCGRCRYKRTGGFAASRWAASCSQQVNQAARPQAGP